MTDTQVADVRDLTRKAGITATVTRLRPGHPLLTQLAPGERTYVAPSTKPAPNVRSERRDRPTGANPKRTKSTRGAKHSHTPTTRDGGAPADLDAENRRGGRLLSRIPQGPPALNRPAQRGLVAPMARRARLVDSLPTSW